MENQLVWEKRFNIGVDVIDKEHQKLFRIINKLFTFGEDEEKSEWVCREGIKYFKDHAMKHFADEEAYMESINYKVFGGCSQPLFGRMYRLADWTYVDGRPCNCRKGHE